MKTWDWGKHIRVEAETELDAWVEVVDQLLGMDEEDLIRSGELKEVPSLGVTDKHGKHE